MHYNMHYFLVRLVVYVMIYIPYATLIVSLLDACADWPIVRRSEEWRLVFTVTAPMYVHCILFLFLHNPVECLITKY